MVGIRPKQFVDQHDYHIMKQSKVQGTQQIRADIMLSRQMYEDKQKQFEEQIKQLENKRSNEYHLNQMRGHIIPDQSNFVIKDRVDPSQDRYDDQRSGKHDCDERIKNPKLTGYFQGKANLTAGKVAGYYYNIHARVTFKNPPSKQGPEDETSLLNQRIWNHTQAPPLTNHYSISRDNQSMSTPRMAKPHSESREGKPNQF